MNIQIAFGGRLDHQALEFRRAIDGERAAKTLLSQLQGDRHAGFGDAIAAQRNRLAGVDKQGFIGGLVEVMHVLAEACLAGINVFGTELALALLAGLFIGLQRQVVDDAVEPLAHGRGMKRIRPGDGKLRRFLGRWVLVNQRANLGTAHITHLFVK
ncbi:hypothetical protein D3C84_756400 [compost metagenome]